MIQAAADLFKVARKIGTKTAYMKVDGSHARHHMSWKPKQLAFSWIAGAIATFGAAASAHAQIPCRYEVAHIIQGPPCPLGGSSVTVGTSISPNGRWVVGRYRQCAISEDQAFVYDTQTMQFNVLPVGAGPFNTANDVNDAGIVVGRAEDDGFLYDLNTGQLTMLPPAVASGGICTVNAINALNVVCGTRTIQMTPNERTTAFRWSAKTGFEDLGLIEGTSTSGADINDDGTYCGWRGNSLSSTNTRGFVRKPDDLILLPPGDGGTNSVCVAINDQGAVCGNARYATPSGNVVRAFRWDNGVISDLGVCRNHEISHGLGISDQFVVVGLSRNLGAPADERAVVWLRGECVDVNELCDSEMHLDAVLNINFVGQLVVSASDSGGVASVILNPITVAGDVTGDCRTGVPDLLEVINEWGHHQSHADLNGDGIVGVPDLITVIKNWTW